MQELEISRNEENQRINKYIQKVLPNTTSSFIYKMFRKKNILLNDSKIEGSEILKSGDHIKFYFSDETFSKFSGNENLDTSEYVTAYKKLINTKIIYEDDNIIAVFKDKNILSQKASIDDASINEWLMGYLIESNKISENTLKSFHPSICNRLDRNTTGIILCSKTLAGSQLLSLHIKDRTIKKFYYAVVEGIVNKEILLHDYLSKDKAINTVKISADKENENTVEIKTRIWPVSNNGKVSLIKIELITGKTHQIRAHLAYINHPIIGDKKYGNVKMNNIYLKKYGVKDQMLCAIKIQFPKMEAPLTILSNKTIEADLDETFSKLAKDEGLI